MTTSIIKGSRHCGISITVCMCMCIYAYVCVQNVFNPYSIISRWRKTTIICIENIIWSFQTLSRTASIINGSRHCEVPNNICVHMYICVCIYVCMYVYMYIYVCVYIRVCRCVYVCVYMCVYMCVLLSPIELYKVILRFIGIHKYVSSVEFKRCMSHTYTHIHRYI